VIAKIVPHALHRALDGGIVFQGQAVGKALGKARAHRLALLGFLSCRIGLHRDNFFLTRQTGHGKEEMSRSLAFAGMDTPSPLTCNLEIQEPWPGPYPWDYLDQCKEIMLAAYEAEDFNRLPPFRVVWSDS
jgi:hypothetical protein